MINKLILETLRNQLNISKQEFSKNLNIDHDDYLLFEKNNNYDMFPAHSILKLREIMLEEERKNFIAYKEKFAIEKQGIFSSSKIVAHFDKLAMLFNPEQKEQVGPITVEFHPSTKCNHACPGCTFNIGTLSADKRFNFDTELLDQLLIDLEELNVRGIDISGGGEPLCHPEIDDILASFAAKFDVGLVTNGGLLNEAHNEAIVDNCLWCRVSLDAGSQKVYNEMHGNISSVNFDDIISKIKALGATKLRKKSSITLGVSFLLTPTNFMDVLPAINIIKDIPGIDYFQTKPIVLNPGTRLDLNMIFWDKRLFDLLTVIGSYSTDTFNVFTLSYKFSDMILGESTGVAFKKCYGHPFYPTIAANGAVFICCHMLNNYFNNNLTGYYGKINKHCSFAKIWEDPFFNRFKIGENIQTRFCAINCKCSETNKMLMQLDYEKIMHKNFIN